MVPPSLLKNILVLGWKTRVSIRVRQPHRSSVRVVEGDPLVIKTTIVSWEAPQRRGGPKKGGGDPQFTPVVELKKKTKVWEFTPVEEKKKKKKGFFWGENKKKGKEQKGEKTEKREKGKGKKKKKKEKRENKVKIREQT